eukprot:2921445-Pyramimonas_sp.AAC.2
MAGKPLISRFTTEAFNSPPNFPGEGGGEAAAPRVPNDLRVGPSATLLGRQERGGYERSHAGEARYSAVQSSVVQYNTLQCSTVQYSTVQYSAVQYGVLGFHPKQGWPIRIRSIIRYV